MEREHARPVALVSGGSRGIGAAIVDRLARGGYDVAFCFRSDQEAADVVAEKAGQHGATTLHRRVDVSDFVAVDAFVREVVEHWRAPQCVVAAAGVIRDCPAMVLAKDQWDEVLRTNLDGTFHLLRAAVRPMARQGGGSMITLSSVAGVAGNPGQINYSASKAGIIGLTKSLAKEIGRYGIRVNSVAPGLIRTDMTADMPEVATKALMARTAMSRMGTAEEVAEAVAFLGGEQSSYITGQVLQVDGGVAL